jgi:hypothetical protein
MTIAALFTALAAGATTWMAVSTGNLARATKTSVDTAERAFEREKDALLPMLQMTWALAEEADASDRQPFVLTVTNAGVGPAFIREITVRNEVNRPAVYRSPLRRAVVPSGHRQSAELDREPGYSLAGPRLSSISLWYQDVYDRWYRSRLLFRYERSTQTLVDHVVLLFLEYDRLTSPPPYAWDTLRDPRPPNYVGLAEGGRCIPWNPIQVGEEWHTLAALAKAQSIEVAGHAVCGRRLLRVKDMGFWLDTAWPQFTVEVRGHRPWVLGVRSIGFRNPSAQDVTVLTTDEFPRGWTGSLPAPLSPGLPDQDWNQFGLVLGPGASQQLWDLYQTIWRAVEARIAAPPKPGPT